MELIDVAVKDLEMIGDCRTCGNKTPFCDSNPDSRKGYKWRGAPHRSVAEENSPLTLEELLEMDGEPVYVTGTFTDCRGKRPGAWSLVDVKQKMCRVHGGGLAIFENYKKYWIAYRCKPEEDA